MPERFVLQISFVRHENPIDLYDYIATFFADLSVELSQQELLACLLMGERFYEEKYVKTERLYSSPLYSMRRRLNEGIIPGIKPLMDRPMMPKIEITKKKTKPNNIKKKNSSFTFTADLLPFLGSQCD